MIEEIDLNKLERLLNKYGDLSVYEALGKIEVLEIELTNLRKEKEKLIHNIVHNRPYDETLCLLKWKEKAEELQKRIDLVKLCEDKTEMKNDVDELLRMVDELSTEDNCFEIQPVKDKIITCLKKREN